jgi:hypothetical protein
VDGGAGKRRLTADKSNKGSIMGKLATLANTLAIALSATSLCACNTVGQITVKDYKATSGERVMAGQAAPKNLYGCNEMSRDSQDWGFQGNLDRASAIQQITHTAVNAAPGKGANYVYVKAPSEKSIGGLDTNAFADAQVAYYKCANLPASG